MPILTRDEFERIVPLDQARQLCREPGEFAAAEESAAQEFVDLTGLDVPADATLAPSWAKRPVAHIIYWLRLPVFGQIDENLRQYVKSLYDAAIESLKRHQIQQPTGRVEAQVVEMEGMAKW